MKKVKSNEARHRKPNMKQFDESGTYEHCPNCGERIHVADGETEIECPGCGEWVEFYIDDLYAPYNEGVKESRVKKLNISKKQFGESKYFQTKYGTLKYVSESGNLYKTSKGNVLKFNESILPANSALKISMSSKRAADESIMSANDMRAASSKSKKDIINKPEYIKGMKTIERDIRQAAMEGETHTYWNIYEELEWPFMIDTPEYEMCIKELKEAGYKVELDDDSDEDYQLLTVSWDE